MLEFGTLYSFVTKKKEAARARSFSIYTIYISYKVKGVLYVVAIHVYHLHYILNSGRS